MPTLKELCRAAEGELKGPPGLQITGVASLLNAAASDIAPVESTRWLARAAPSKAGAFLAHIDLASRIDRPVILSRFPLAALNRVIEALGLVAPPHPPGIHPSAIIDPEAKLGADVHVGANAIIGKAKIGARSVLRARVVVEDTVEMGDDCLV
ncbi:MAG: UDP-3-O-(3-hydroxymyristoyl)glucosamine N-acyltransferase, partial [Planctomycetota bacterium]